MKTYPSIEYFGSHWGLPIIAFDKLDGSNLRFEFSQKRGFYKFGTRKMMIDSKTDQFGFAIDLFLNKYNENLQRIFKSKEYRNIPSFVCYAELLGKKSSFGQHDFSNDEFDITLFDVDRFQKGFIPPREFIKFFGEIGIPRIVYEGNLNKEFVEDVKRNKFELSEGVIAKGVIEGRKQNAIFQCKIKTNDWFDRLRALHPVQYMDEVKEYNQTPK